MKADLKNEARNEEPKTRSIALPFWLWQELDDDAKRCKRSATKQIEAFLTLVYDPEADLELDGGRIVAAFQATSPKQLKKAG